MTLFPLKKYRLFLFVGLILFCFPNNAKSEEFFLEPVIQGYAVNELVPIIKVDDTFFIDIRQMAEILQFQLDIGTTIQGKFLEKDFTINMQNLPSSEYRYDNGKYYFSIAFYERLFPIKMTVDSFEMQLQISSDQNLPLAQNMQKEKRRENFVPMPAQDSFSNYQFDNRLWSAPVVDLTYQRGFAINDYNGPQEKQLNSDSYQINSGMLLGGFDAYTSIFGGTTANNTDPRARFTIGRTFLDEPKNALNLTTFEAGDVTDFNSTLFNNSGSGRGVFASSFKDLVTSADKTIDLSGPLSQGWDVELYQNDQLIGFRQNGINGQYQFSNIPVSYGLNVFKLVFYGPYGEIQTEERNYYSGTSPVKPGEFGYTINAYQKDHYLFEKNEPYINPSNKAIVDYMGYYGLNDNMTLISGLTQAPDMVTDEELNFGTAGMQLIYSGASLQYNTMYNFESAEVGHHFDVQGNVYIGDIFARYDYYGKLYSPISYYNDEYLKDTTEFRLTGYIPWMSLPYYLSYQENTTQDNEKIQEAHVRLSPNFMRYYNFTLENIWTKDQDQTSNDVVVLLQAQFDNLGIHSQARYQLDPSSYIKSFGQQVDYRWNRYTYFQANWDRDMRSEYSQASDLDRFSISAGRLFDFGGLTLALSYDTDKNAAISLTYNMSFGKVPGQYSVFTNSQTQMSERAALYAKLVDEQDKPINGTQLRVSGLQDPITTDENGEALITDIEPYQKTILSIDPKSVEDVSLVPEFESKKLVMRPGTVLPITIRFAHKGALEGYISGADNLFNYNILLTNSNGDLVASKAPEEDGSFIFDDVSFGKYKLLVTNKEKKILTERNVVLDQDFISLPEAIVI